MASQARSSDAAARELGQGDARASTNGQAEASALFRAWQRDGDQRARERLVERYMPLTRRLARRYVRGTEPLDDLLQVASIGLVNAIDRFDVTRGRPFAAFAVPTILGEMRRYFRDSGWALHVPRTAKERALEVRDAAAELHAGDGRSPTAKQLAEYLELEIDEVLDAMAAMDAHQTSSLDAPRPSEDGPGVSYADSIGEEDERFDLIECDATLCAALGELKPRDREILRMRYVEELTQAEIASRIGVSQMHVSRLLRRSVEKLQLLTRAPAATQ